MKNDVVFLVVGLVVLLIGVLSYFLRANFLFDNVLYSIILIAIGVIIFSHGIRLFLKRRKLKRT